MKPFWKFNIDNRGWFYATHDEEPRILISIPPEDWGDEWGAPYSQSKAIGMLLKKAAEEV